MYVVRSASTGQLYVGHTGNLKRRLAEHNDRSHNRRKYTSKQPGPWVLVYDESFDTRSQAMRREKWFKSGTGRDWLAVQIKKNCGQTDKLLG